MKKIIIIFLILIFFFSFIASGAVIKEKGHVFYQYKQKNPICRHYYDRPYYCNAICTDWKFFDAQWNFSSKEAGEHLVNSGPMFIQSGIVNEEIGNDPNDPQCKADKLLLNNTTEDYFNQDFSPDLNRFNLKRTLNGNSNAITLTIPPTGYPDGFTNHGWGSYYLPFPNTEYGPLSWVSLFPQPGVTITNIEYSLRDFIHKFVSDDHYLYAFTKHDHAYKTYFKTNSDHVIPHIWDSRVVTCDVDSVTYNDKGRFVDRDSDIFWTTPYCGILGESSVPNPCDKSKIIQKTDYVERISDDYVDTSGGYSLYNGIIEYEVEMERIPQISPAPHYPKINFTEEYKKIAKENGLTLFEEQYYPTDNLTFDINAIDPFYSACGKEGDTPLGLDFRILVGEKDTEVIGWAPLKYTSSTIEKYTENFREKEREIETYHGEINGYPHGWTRDTNIFQKMVETGYVTLEVRSKYYPEKKYKQHIYISNCPYERIAPVYFREGFNEIAKKIGSDGVIVHTRESGKIVYLASCKTNELKKELQKNENNNYLIDNFQDNSPLDDIEKYYTAIVQLDYPNAYYDTDSKFPIYTREQIEKAYQKYDTAVRRAQLLENEYGNIEELKIRLAYELATQVVLDDHETNGYTDFFSVFSNNGGVCYDQALILASIMHKAGLTTYLVVQPLSHVRNKAGHMWVRIVKNDGKVIDLDSTFYKTYLELPPRKVDDQTQVIPFPDLIDYQNYERTKKILERAKDKLTGGGGSFSIKEEKQNLLFARRTPTTIDPEYCTANGLCGKSIPVEEGMFDEVIQSGSKKILIMYSEWISFDKHFTQEYNIQFLGQTTNVYSAIIEEAKIYFFNSEHGAIAIYSGGDISQTEMQDIFASFIYDRGAVKNKWIIPEKENKECVGAGEKSNYNTLTGEFDQVCCSGLLATTKQTAPDNMTKQYNYTCVDCGDGICSANEDYESCSLDCPAPDFNCDYGYIETRLGCKKPNTCGNGIVEEGEECDTFYATQNCSARCATINEVTKTFDINVTTTQELTDKVSEIISTEYDSITCDVNKKSNFEILNINYKVIDATTETVQAQITLTYKKSCNPIKFLENKEIKEDEEPTDFNLPYSIKAYWSDSTPSLLVEYPKIKLDFSQINQNTQLENYFSSNGITLQGNIEPSNLNWNKYFIYSDGKLTINFNNPVSAVYIGGWETEDPDYGYTDLKIKVLGEPDNNVLLDENITPYSSEIWLYTPTPTITTIEIESADSGKLSIYDIRYKKPLVQNKTACKDKTTHGPFNCNSLSQNTCNETIGCTYSPANNDESSYCSGGTLTANCEQLDETSCIAHPSCKYNNNEEGQYCYSTGNHTCDEFTPNNCPTEYGCTKVSRTTNAVAACDGTYTCFD